MSKGCRIRPLINVSKVLLMKDVVGVQHILIKTSDLFPQVSHGLYKISVFPELKELEK